MAIHQARGDVDTQLESAVEARVATTYNRLLSSNPDLGRRARETLVAAHSTHGLMINDRMLCNVLRPRFLSTSSLSRLVQASEVLAEIFERAGDLILHSDGGMELIAATEQEQSIWGVDPGYARFTVTSRLDSFMAGEFPQYVEYNAESPAGIGYSDVLAEVFSRMGGFEESRGKQTLARLDGLPHLLSSLLDTYREWGGTGTPTIAIIDWEDVITARDFHICAEYFRRAGVPVVIADPRALDLRSGNLWYRDEQISLVYRRVLLHELLAKASEAAPLLQAYREGAVCMVNSPRSKILHKKSVFALLSDRSLGLEVSAEEERVLDSCVPWTRIVSDTTTDFCGKPVHLLPFIQDRQDDMALKPVDDYGGRGVFLGWDMTRDEWARALHTAIDEHYVVQQRVPVPQSPFPVWQDERVAVVDLLVDTNPYLFAGKAKSLLTRVSGSVLLNVSAGAGSTVPTFVVSEEG